ncbi:MAG: hypothetical protein NTV01_18040, partial [Bacteroidia bacterium]|nr:hypothetical protein [Bacteroidia bacterium]
MLKRLLPYIFILLIAVPAGIFLFSRRDKQVTAYQSKAMTAVPEDAVWIIESGSVPELLKALIQSEPLFTSLQHIGNIDPYLQAFRKIDSLITLNSRFRELYSHSPAVVSLHQTGKTQYQFLMILETQGTSGSEGAGDFFSELCSHPGQWSKRIYNSQQIN